MARDEISITMIGDKALERKLRSLEGPGQRRVMRSAISAGLTPILQEARRRTEWTSLRKLLAKRVSRRKRGDRGLFGSVFFRPHKTRTITLNGREVGFEVVASILEFGTKDGRIPAHNMLRGARQAKHSEAIGALTRKAEERFKIEWAKR